MPPPKKTVTARQFELRLEGAAGASIQDFYVLGHSTEYDDAFEHTNPPSFDSPTSRFTHVLHYEQGLQTTVRRVDDRLLASWRSPTAEVLAAGFPRSIFHVDSSGVSATAFKGHQGVFTSLWGPTSDHLFACGMVPAFTLYRAFGHWQMLPLPRLPVDVLHALFGFSASDVYCVGGMGIALHFDGQDWTLLEVPTTRGLRSVAPLGAGRVCAAGEDGVLLYGSRAGFRLIPSGTNEIIQNLAAFDGAIYYGTSDGVYRFDGLGLPTLALRQPAMKVEALNDGLLIQNGTQSWTWDGHMLLALDTAIVR